MKKCAILWALALLSVFSTSANAVSATGKFGDPFTKEREKKADGTAKKKKNRPAPDPQPEIPKHEKEKTPNYSHHGKDRDHDKWRRPRTVIIERPVYVPIPSYDPYNPYEAQARREDALLEVVGKQMRFALRENPILKPFKLDTDTVGDSVEIEGTVDTLAQMQLALDVARNIDSSTRIVITRIKIRQK